MGLFFFLTDSSCLEECQRQLRTIYTAKNKVKIVPWEQSSAVHIDEIYTDLSWFKDNRKPSGVTQEKLENYTDIFASGKNSQAPKRILVYGRPGIGKTVFTQKTTFDWSEQRFKGNLGTFELVLLVKLRDVRNFDSIPSLLRDSKLLAADGEISVDELYHYVRDHQEKVLLILDGYDENSAINQSPVREIWERKQLRDCCVVITTRHMKADELRGPSDAQFEIDGFDNERQVEFTRRFLKDEEDVEAFFEYLEQQNLKEIAEIPLLLLMLCLVWREKDRRGLPTSRAKIYDQFIQTFYDHLFEKYSSDAVAGKVDDYTDELCQLGNLAFDALLLDSLFFPLSKLPDHDLIKKLIDVGLFHMLNLPSLNREQGVYFLHKSLQEYLASRFLKEELLSEKSENTPSLDSIDSIEKILKMDEVFKFACEMSEKAASAVLSHLGMVAKKEGLIEYSFMETPSHKDLSDEQRNFLTLCGQCFFSCSAETRRDVFPAFLSYTQDVLLLTNSSQLHIIANEHLLKTTESPNYIFSYEDSKHPEEDYYKLITVVQDLNAVVVSCSGKKKASEFLKKYQYRSVDEFFLKNEQNAYLYFARIFKSALGDSHHRPFPTEMLKELITAPESTAQKNTKDEDKQSSEQDNSTGLFFTKDSDSTSCSAHCLSMVWDIIAVDVDRSEIEVLTDVIPLVIAPRVILVYGKTDECSDAQLTETLVTRINYTNRLGLLTLSGINLTAKSAAFISNSLHKVPNLSSLNLSSNPLGEGVSVLIKHLTCVPDLEELGLYNVMMTKEQVHDLTTAVRQSNISELESDYHVSFSILSQFVSLFFVYSIFNTQLLFSYFFYSCQLI